MMIPRVNPGFFFIYTQLDRIAGDIIFHYNFAQPISCATLATEQLLKT